MNTQGIVNRVKDLAKAVQAKQAAAQARQEAAEAARTQCVKTYANHLAFRRDADKMNTQGWQVTSVSEEGNRATFTRAMMGPAVFLRKNGKITAVYTRAAS